MSDMEEKAKLLMKVLEKHNPTELSAMSMRMMLNLEDVTKGDVKKVCAALYELMEALK